MRKLILISAFALVSVSAHAGETRGPKLAANDTPTYTEVAPPAPPAPPAVAPAPAAATTPAPVAATTPAATPAAPAPAPVASTTPAQKSPKKAQAHESNEHKARRIAAKYGVYW